MTIKQKRFVEEYLIDLNATQAAIRAGYSEKTAYSAGQRMLKNVEVRSYIEERQKQARNKRIMTAEKRMERLSDIAMNHDVKPSDVVKAIDVLNKMTGEYVSKVEISEVDKEKSKLDDLIKQMCGGTGE